MSILRTVVLAAALAAAALPATASAGTVSSSGGELRFTAAPGERNLLLVYIGDGNWRIEDHGPAPATAGAGCTTTGDAQEAATAVVCPQAGVDRVTVDMGDGNDRLVLFSHDRPAAVGVAVSGGAGTDSLAAAGPITLDGVTDDGPRGRDDFRSDVEKLSSENSGTDDVFTGSDGANSISSDGGTDVFAGAGGDDYIRTRDVRFDLEQNGSVPPDRVSCGAGMDIADVDDADVVAADCEIVIRQDGEVRLTAGADTFRAPRPGLTIFGLGGDDTIAAGGARSVSGGAGDDRITLGSALDIVASGDAGDDRIYGLSARDRIDGGRGDDKLYGERSADRIDGGPGRDGISGGRGDDAIRVRDGERDRVRCGTGRDVVVADRLDLVARDCERVRRAG